MIIKKIVQVGDPRIRQKSKPVSLKDIKSSKVRGIIKDLKDTIEPLGLIGMSASQAGKNLQIFVVKIRNSKYRKDIKELPLMVFVNPKIISCSKKQTTMYEGCGSVAHAKLMGPVRRPEKVTVSAYNEKGKKFIMKADGLLAKVIQHEYDHLLGIVFTDKLTDPKLVMSDTEYFKAVKAGKI